MLRTRLLTFAALVVAHVAASFATIFPFAFQTGLPELLFWVIFLPMHLLGQIGEDHPDLFALVGIPEDSTLAFVLFVSVNSLLWVAGAYGLWLAGQWTWRRVGRASE